MRFEPAINLAATKAIDPTTIPRAIIVRADQGSITRVIYALA